MARMSKEDAQDVAMHHMDKISKRNPGSTRELSLREQIEAASVSPTEKMKKMSQYNWNRDLDDAILRDRDCNAILANHVKAAHKKEFIKFKENGTSFREIISFIKSLEQELLDK